MSGVSPQADAVHTVGALIPRVAAATLLILIAGTFATGNNAAGNFNRLLYLCILAVCLALTVLFVRGQAPSTIDMALAVFASCGLIWGIATIERPQLLAGGYWEGFGIRVALASVVLVLLFGTIVRPRHFNRPVRIGLGLIIGLCCLCDILGAIRTLDYMPYVNNNLNEINDLLGPVVGKVPESTFIPEYNPTYGWLFLPLKGLLSPLALVGAMSIFLSLLGIAAVALAVWIAYRILGRGRLLLAAVLIVPITYVTSRSTGDVSSIASAFQELPMRLLSGLIILAVGLEDLAHLYRGRLRARQLLGIGVLCGLIVWNSQDFGLAAAGVYFLVVLFGASSTVRVRALGLWSAGLAVGIATYPLFLVAIGSPLNLSFIGAFIKLFGSGLASAPIQVPGPVLVVLPIIICSIAAGWALMRAHRRQDADPDPILDRAIITLTFVGTWSALCLVYYVDRAYAAGQLQTMLLPCGLCVAALMSIVLRTHELTARLTAKPWVLGRDQLPTVVTMIPFGLFAGVCASSLLLTANPFAEVGSLLHPPVSASYADFDLPHVLSDVSVAQRYTSGKPGDLTYLGESFNYVSLDTHVPSNAVLFPWSLAKGTALTRSVTQIECPYLADHHSTWMVLSIDGLAAFGPSACGLYTAVDVPGVAFGQIQELK